MSFTHALLLLIFIIFILTVPHALPFTRTQVYDVTAFLSKHPGGRQILFRHSGHVDATAFFEAHTHSAIAHEIMRHYLLWDASLYLGKLGTILGLFKLVAFPSIYSPYPKYPLYANETRTVCWYERCLIY